VLSSGDPELVISGDIADASTEANALNEAGICTYINIGGEYRTWGNRSAAFPTNTAPENFLSVQMTADVIHDSIEQAMLPFIDQPLTAGLIDSIQETVNGFIRTLIGRGALIDGSYCVYNPAKNPVEQLALGQIVFDIVMMPPVAAERITFESFIDIKLLANLNIQ
jgi:phage tail sheath protein FI